jgi:hypothetical protein
MTNRISLLSLVAASLFFNSCKKGETGPMGEMGLPGTNATAVIDPDSYPKISVDRFSSVAGHLMVRTSMNGLPAINAPINFDEGPFITSGKTPDGKITEYYNFDVQPTTPAPIYVLFREGETAPVKGQRNIINVKPGDAGYNDFWQVVKVTVPSNYLANTLTSLNAIQNGGYKTETTNIIVNCPVVPEGSRADKRFINETGALIKGWYKDSIAFYFNFGEKNLSGTTVPVAPIYVTFNTNGVASSGFVTEPGTSQTHNVVGAVPTDANYSPLWSVNVYDNANFATVMNLSDIGSATILANGVANVNCPIVVIK